MNVGDALDMQDILQQINPGITPIYENALKIKVLRLGKLGISQVDIYKKIVGELKDDGHKTDPMPPADEYYYSSHKASSVLPRGTDGQIW